MYPPPPMSFRTDICQVPNPHFMLSPAQTDAMPHSSSNSAFRHLPHGCIDCDSRWMSKPPSKKPALVKFPFGGLPFSEAAASMCKMLRFKGFRTRLFTPETLHHKLCNEDGVIRVLLQRELQALQCAARCGHGDIVDELLRARAASRHW